MCTSPSLPLPQYLLPWPWSSRPEKHRRIEQLSSTRVDQPLTVFLQETIQLVLTTHPHHPSSLITLPPSLRFQTAQRGVFSFAKVSSLSPAPAPPPRPPPWPHGRMAGATRRSASEGRRDDFGSRHWTKEKEASCLVCSTHLKNMSQRVQSSPSKG